jgi:hypothetical protein
MVDFAREERARDAAKMLVGLFQMIFQAASPEMSPEKMADFLRLALVDPSQLEEILYKGFLEDGVSDAEVNEMQTQLTKASESPRKFFAEVIRSELPSGSPGRKKVLTPAVLTQMVDLANKLLPSLRAFMSTRTRTSKRSAKDVIEFLSLDFPETSDYLIEHAGTLEALVSNKRLMQSARSLEGKAKLLSYAMAGAEFDLKPSYAIRQIRSAIFSRNRSTK